jgi:ATP-dependent DNA ligase
VFASPCGGHLTERAVNYMLKRAATNAGFHRAAWLSCCRHHSVRAPGAVHLWAFDLLAFNGCDPRAQPLVKRHEDGLALLRVAEARGLEGVVSKRRSAPYRSGECRDWRKVKTLAWREANSE